MSDITAQIERNRKEMAELKRQAIQSGDATGTLAARQKGLAVATAEANLALAAERRNLHENTGTASAERYEAAARELGEGVVGLLVMRNGWEIMVGYDDEADEWNAVSEVVVHEGSQVTTHECEGRGASPSTAVERCVFHLERVTA